MQRFPKQAVSPLTAQMWQNELTAVQNVYNEYQTSVEYGFVDPETGIAEMNDKMMTAGSRRLSTRKRHSLQRGRKQTNKV